MNIFAELSVIIVLATLVSCIMRLLRQPLVVGYILTGIISGPYFFNFLQHSTDYIELLSKIGITILLFIVGLNLNPLVIKEVGKASLVAGLGQIMVTWLAGYGIVRWLGFDTITAAYIAIALTFSSTIIILKVLSDKGDLTKLYGKISVGILLVQDLVATLILLIVSTISASQSAHFVADLSLLLGKGILIVTALFLIARFLLPRLNNFLGSSQELLFIFSLAWGLALPALLSQIGFSVEISALVAGVALSLSPFAYEIAARIKPLRDFFIILFFILLGSQMVIGNVQELLIPGIILSLFVLLLKPVIVLVLMNMLRYKRKTGFMTGLTMAQISEFSLILAAMGLSIGHLSREAASLITLVGIVTIAGSTYFTF